MESIDIEKILDMHKKDNTEPKMLKKLLRYSQREKTHKVERDNDEYKIKKRNTPLEVIL